MQIVDYASKMSAYPPPKMSPEPAEDHAVRLKRLLRRLFVTVGLAVLSVLALVYYLWEHSPKPP